MRALRACVTRLCAVLRVKTVCGGPAVLVYRLIISVFALVVLVKALRHGQIAARLGMTKPASGRHLWIHGASNGELNSARHVIEAVLDARRDLNLVITCNSDTGSDLVRSWHLHRVTSVAAPVDLAWVTRRFYRRWRIVAHITLEAEVWPHRVLLCPGPVVLLGGRMRAGTARGWSRFRGLAARVMQKFSYVSTQDPDSLARLRALGVQEAGVGPVVDLKAYYTPPADKSPDAAQQYAYPRHKTWLAASTHAGEEPVVLGAFQLARRQEPDLRLILAPRHAARADEVAALIRQAGLPLSRRSTGDAPDPAKVYLADTMGEMALWYALAGRVFIGGTMTDRGGHTPYEPAAYHCAILHGPDVANFAQPFKVLDARGGAVLATDAPSLAHGVIRLRDPAVQRATGDMAHKLLRPRTDLTSLVRSVLAQLPPA